MTTKSPARACVQVHSNCAKSTTRGKHAFFIEGGGTKGIYAVGILKHLFEVNPYLSLQQVDIFGGTSVGSYLAAALSLGCTSVDIDALMSMINLEDLIDSKSQILWTIYRLVTKGYLYSDDGKAEIIRTILSYKLATIKSDLGVDVTADKLTFGQLQELIKINPVVYKHLIVNVVDINRHEQIFMTSLDDKSKNITLFDALMASSAIPFVFKPVTMHYDATTDSYGLNGSERESNLLDGGVSTNNPLDYFLLHDDRFTDYNLWLLKFTVDRSYVPTNSAKLMLKELFEYSVSGKNDVKFELIEDTYNIKVINLKLSAGTFDIYDQEQMKAIIADVYEDFVKGEISVV